MPLYEYICNECRHRFEVIQKFSDAPMTHCAQCPGTVTKLISPPGLSFKGSGWYITDYSSKSKPPDSKEHVEPQHIESQTKSEEKGTGEASKSEQSTSESAQATSPSSSRTATASTPSPGSSAGKSTTTTTPSSPTA